MIDSLRDEVYRPGVTLVVQSACLEMFFVHVRSLVGFLVLEHSDSTKDFTAKDIHPEYRRPTDKQLLKRLNAYWNLASQQVVHFSKRRVKQEDGTAVVVDVTPTALAAIADDVLTAWDHYASYGPGRPFMMPRSEFTWRVARQLAVEE